MSKSHLSWQALISEAKILCARAARASEQGQSLRARAYLDEAAAILDRTDALRERAIGPPRSSRQVTADRRRPPRRAPSQTRFTS
jgi:hypothetical protein